MRNTEMTLLYPTKPVANKLKPHSDEKSTPNLAVIALSMVLLMCTDIAGLLIKQPEILACWLIITIVLAFSLPHLSKKIKKIRKKVRQYVKYVYKKYTHPLKNNSTMPAIMFPFFFVIYLLSSPIRTYATKLLAKNKEKTIPTDDCWGENPGQNSSILFQETPIRVRKKHN